MSNKIQKNNDGNNKRDKDAAGNISGNGAL